METAMNYLPTFLVWRSDKKLKIGPLQLAIHVVQKSHAGEQKSHWDKTNKRHA